MRVILGEGKMITDYVGIFIGISILLFVLAVSYKPTRKALGVVICLLGLIECLSGIFILVGLPTVFIGVVLLLV